MSKSYCRTEKKKRKGFMQDPRYSCKECGIGVHKKKQVCRPVKMK